MSIADFCEKTNHVIPLPPTVSPAATANPPIKARRDTLLLGMGDLSVEAGLTSCTEASGSGFIGDGS